MKIADRVQQIQESKSVGLSRLVEELKRKGEDIIGLNVGEPDFVTPQMILEATKTALDAGHTRYSHISGLVELRERVCEKLVRDNNIKAKPENVLIGNGSKQILYTIMQAFINPGDEVIIPRPYWVSFPESVRLAGGNPIFVETDHFDLDIESIRKAITKKTKMIILNSPNNPSGAIYSEDKIRSCLDLAISNNFLIVSDEAYELMCFDRQHLSPASLSQEAFEHIITVQSFSKSFCMTGFRLGYAVGSQKLIQAMTKIQSHMSGNPCTFAQKGAESAFLLPPSVIEKMKEELNQRRLYSLELFGQLFDIPTAQGAFYLFMNAKKYLDDQRPNCSALAQDILSRAKVALLPGSAFGVDGYLRLSYTSNKETLKRAYERISEIL